MNGVLLGRRYELLEKIDSGGMADIYKALCKKTNCVVAVKILKECFSDKKEYIERFKREAESVFSLDHENIVRVTDIGHDEGAYYMVMEYIEGPTLKAIIDERKRLDEKEAVEYAIQLCCALTAAHKKGIIHRDIKPHNVLIDKDGTIKLTDFGIAKSVASKEEKEHELIGSVHYISPEQAKGERADTRSDIYSMGIMLYEMLTGELPHTGVKTVSVALKHINEQIVPPAELRHEISKSVNNIVLKATGKNKRDRYQSAADLKKDLISSLSDSEGGFVDLPAVYRDTVKTPLQRKKNLLWKFGMLFLLIAAAASMIIVGIVIFGSQKQASAIPNLIGLDVDTVTKRLKNVPVTATYEPSESAAEGIIISQSPEAGANAANAGPINITISSGPADPVMPDIVGMPLEEARALIDSIGVVLKEENINYEYHQDTQSGIIISQTPEIGAPITKESILSLIVSDETAQASVIMPDLSGKLVDQAISFLQDSGFSECFVYEDDSELPEGTVLRQYPEIGIQTTYSEAVTLTISRYKSRYFINRFNKYINIAEKESKVKIVIQEMINGEMINLVSNETVLDAGGQWLSFELGSTSRGKKIVAVYVNNVEEYSVEVEFR